MSNNKGQTGFTGTKKASFSSRTLCTGSRSSTDYRTSCGENFTENLKRSQDSKALIFLRLMRTCLQQKLEKLRSRRIHGNIKNSRWKLVGKELGSSWGEMPGRVLYQALENDAPSDIIPKILGLDDDFSPSLNTPFQSRGYSYKYARYMSPESRRFAIHLAAEKLEQYGMDVLRELIFLNEDSLTWPDVRGRTPLHICIEHYAYEDSLVNAIELLCDHAPSTTGMEDFDGSTPIELAVIGEKEASADVLDILHERTSKWDKIREGQSERYRLFRRKISFH